MELEQVAHDFVPDGRLRDIYVLETDAHDWQTVLDRIRSFQPPPTYTVDGVPEDLPEHIGHIFQRRSDASPMMSFQLLGMLINCHFFGSNEFEGGASQIEFDLDPREVSGSNQLRALVGFMEMLGRTTSKTIVLTPENCIESPILKWSVETKTVI